ncbi:Uncharacterised protein [Mycobacteroides abscessus subsp. bolletii]|nr:Uncharacterised protein [Mycobacteroides abscessus subsp. bolletii]
MRMHPSVQLFTGVKYLVMSARWRGATVAGIQDSERRARIVKAIRRSTELEGSRSTDATRADQDAYVRGTITATELVERVRRRYDVQ